VGPMLIEAREERALGERLLRGFGNAEIDDLGCRPAILKCDQNVRRLEIAVNDALLVSMLHGVANLDE
jgi:hypothetical protein